ncbi:MAG: histidine kinase [Flavobacteriaceae bacterium]|nr:histidine kinase [Flavobacteriaceae bacterium]|tara:strand:- start:32778 stop:33875 length:1098 start_codon:yes stop_codon:yes gene_type:complete
MFIKSTVPKEIAQEIKDHIGDHAALISVAENTAVEIPELIDALNKDQTKFIGGIFPKIIHNEKINDEGIVVNTLKNVERLEVIQNISSGNFEVPRITFKENTPYSLVTYVDGLTSNISNFLNKLYEKYGMHTDYFGGGAGSLTLQQKPCVFSNEGFFQDAAVICIMEMKSSIGVKHGWEKLSGPMIVTKADANVIKEINWKNAFDVYKEIVEPDSNQSFTDDNFFDIAKGYPFGIVKTDCECIIRDPLMVDEEGNLVCVGEVEENTMLNLMKGYNASLIDAAKSAALESISKTDKPEKAIIIDCISRILFLEDEFQIELNEIIKVLREKHENISISGALTLGEISSYGEGYLEFYNKTCVVGLFN